MFDQVQHLQICRSFHHYAIKSAQRKGVPTEKKIKFEILFLLPEMKGYERHFEWYFCVVKYC